MVWQQGQNTFLNICLTNANANSKKNQTVKAIMKKHEKKKKSTYNSCIMNVEHGIHSLVKQVLCSKFLSTLLPSFNFLFAKSCITNFNIDFVLLKHFSSIGFFFILPKTVPRCCMFLICPFIILSFRSYFSTFCHCIYLLQ